MDIMDIEVKKQPKSKIDNWFSSISLDKIFNNKPNIAVIRLQGVISDSSFGKQDTISLNNMNPLIEKAFKLSKLSAVCLLINSPGGSPVQSELVAKRIRALADEKDVPVYSFIEDVGASGGYWLACAGDEIYASRSSVVGSIGVVSSGFGFHEAIAKLGVERRIYTAGKNKSVLDAFSPAKDSDIKLLKELQEDVHKHFIDAIKESRGDKLKEKDSFLFTGEFWTGSRAAEYGLIDGIDDMYNFINSKFGDNVNVKIISPKMSWIKSKLGVSGPNIADDILSGLETKSLYSKFGL